MKRVFFLVGFTVVSLSFFASDVFAADGFAEGVIGGAGGETVTVSTAEDLKSFAESTLPYIIQVSGTIDLGTIGGKLHIHSDKTIRGIGSNPTIIGNLTFLSGASNVIIEELNITNPYDYGEGDGITVKYATDIFVTKCTIYDCSDGCLDITRESDYITVSWCKFYYTADFAHRYVNLIGGSDSDTGDIGKLHITFHHNWWSTLCYERMPRVRFGQVHVYNNYYNCTGNNYCIRPGVEAQLLVENNYFDHIDEPIDEKETGALVEAHDNIFNSCTNVYWLGDDDVFTPPYSYTLDSASDVPSIVMAGAGVPQTGKVYYVDAGATGLNNGTSWADAYNHLQDALTSASFGSEIWVAEGVYKPDEDTAHPGGTGSRGATFQLKNGLAIKGGYAGYGAANPNERDSNAYDTILSGDLNGDDGPNFTNNAENSHHVVTGSGTNATAVLDGFIITSGNASSSDIIEGTISHWRFDEGSGSTVYDSIGSNNGYISGAQRAGGALEFDGWDDYVDIADSPSLNVTDGITIGMWIKPYSGMNCDERNNWRFLLAKDEQDWDHYNLIYEASWDVPLIGFSIVTAEGAEYRLWTNSAAYPDEFVYLAFTYDAQTGKQKTYFNGNLDSQQTTAGGSINISSGPLRIGGGINTGCPDGAGFFKGLIDEVAIYDRALSAEEIEQLYDIGQSPGTGGGMFNCDSSNPTLTNCTFSGNSAIYGGGMCNYISSNPTVEGCTFSNNSASNGGGMGNSNSSPKLTNCIFSDNSAGEGGGICNYYYSSPTVTNCTFSRNWATESGGAMENISSSPTLTNCTFSDNSTPWAGGGMDNWYGSSPKLTNCTFSGNSAEVGGGMVNCNYSNPTVTNCAFSNNSAISYGGGMWNYYYSSPTVTNCTFSGNSSAFSDGGGMRNTDNSRPTVTNCILWGNTAPNDPQICNDGTSSAIVNYSCVQGYIKPNKPPTPQGLISYWKLDEGAGNTAYDSAGNNDGTIYGAQWTTGLFDGALSFDGSNDYVSAGTIPELRTTDSFTWSFWVNLKNGNGSTNIIVGNRAQTTGFHFIKFTPTMFEYYNYGHDGSINYSVPTDRWVHLVVVKDSANLTYYSDSSVVGTGIVSQDMPSNLLYFAGDPGYGEYSACRIDEVAIYNRALSAEEIEQFYEYGLGGQGNIGADPLFVAPDSNDFHLLPDSPCINAGDPDYVAGPDETDIDGELRVMLGRIDMGADEFNPFEIDFIIVNKRRIGRTIFEYDCSASLYNISRFDVKNIQLEIVKTPENMKIIDPNVTFGDAVVRAGESATSIDTCTFKVDRSQAIEPMEIIWWSSCELVAAGQTIQHTGSSIVFLEEDNITGDLTSEGKIDFEDLAKLAEQWLGPAGAPSADIAPPGGDGTVNFFDFAELAENWRKE